MRVCVDAALAAAGIGTYARGMAAALGEHAEVTVLAPDRTLGVAGRALWRERHVRSVDADVLLATAPELPVRRLHVPTVVVVHDVFPLSHPELTSRGQRARFRLLLPRVLDRADAIVCVSEATRRELGRDNAVVIGQGPSPFPSLERDPRDYLLYVGEDFPRKNLDTLRRADLGMELRLVGPPPLEFVSEQRLAELYAGAQALVLPSLAEGFGRTVLDAMARGVPVIASDIPALRELTAGRAILVEEPQDPAAWRQAVDELPARAAELTARGRERAAEYAWPKVARQMANLLSATSSTRRR